MTFTCFVHRLWLVSLLFLPFFIVAFDLRLFKNTVLVASDNMKCCRVNFAFVCLVLGGSAACERKQYGGLHILHLVYYYRLVLCFEFVHWRHH